MYVRKSDPGNRVRLALAAATPMRRDGIAGMLGWIALACALVLSRPASALAGWPLAAQGRVTLAFGALYSAGDGDGSRHRGVDIEAAAGERVAAPLAGRVSFVGKIPAVGGGRTTAVTIETSQGKMTLLPLESASVARGVQVAEGDTLGVLAAAGDGSSAGSHLHVGVREGDLYVDPLGLIAPPPAPAEDSGAGAGSATGVPTDAREAGGVAVSVGVPVAVGGAPVTGRVGTARPSVRAGSVAAGEIAPGVSVAVRGAALAAPTPAVRASAQSRGRIEVNAVSAGGLESTVLTKDGVVAAAATGSASRRVDRSAWASGIVARLRAAAERSVRVAGFVLLGAMAALGALWPLWRQRESIGSGKVPVSVVGEDVAAAPGR